MSEAPKRITAWGDQATLGVVYKAGPRPMQNMVPFRATEYTRADLSDALLREAMEALGAALLWTDEEHDVADFRDAARATLAKLRAHLGEKE